jgi:hypothetical protein
MNHNGTLKYKLIQFIFHSESYTLHEYMDNICVMTLKHRNLDRATNWDDDGIWYSLCSNFFHTELLNKVLYVSDLRSIPMKYRSKSEI